MTWGVYPGNSFHDLFDELRDTLTITSGKHTFKVGGDILTQPRNNTNPANPYGTWTFAKDIYFNPNDPNFNWSSLSAAVPTGFTATLNSLPYQNRNLESALYLQDEWKIRRNLTLNLGLRYDLQTLDWNNSLHASLYPSPGLPSFVHFGGHGVYDNFAPRLGFAWDLRGDGKTVVRAGYGIMYSMNSDDIYGGEIATLRQPSISISNKNGITSFPNPYGVNGQPPTVITQTQPNITVNTNNVSNPPANTGSLGVTRQFGPDIALNVDAIYSKITKMPLSVNVNAPYESAPGVLLTTAANVPLPVYGKIAEQETTGNYEYKAILARLEKRYTHHYQYTVSYTLAKQHDNYGNALGFSSAARTDTYYPDLDNGQSAADRRNTLVLSGSTKLPLGIVAGGIYTLRSSTPLSATYSVFNSNGGAKTSGYVPGTTKGLHNKSRLLSEVNAWRATQSLAAIPSSQIRSNGFKQFDTHISKDFSIKDRYKIELIGQLFNVFGTDNFGGIGVNQATAADSATPTFGQITSAYQRQQGELALRFKF